jgi:CDP-diacylglycerol--serine O-phosphatidyltransferase
MKKVALLPNVITAFGLACGLFVIFKINLLEPGSGHYEVVLVSALLLLVAALADFIDGALARAIRAESDFGLVFDSFADAISFGVAPSVLLLKALSLEQGTLLSFLAASGAMVFSLCGVLRLVRFSVNQSASKGDPEKEAAQKKHFTGLPIPAAAAAAVSANLFFLYPLTGRFLELGDQTRAIVLSLVMIFLGYLMVCRLKFPSLKMLHLKVPSFNMVFLTVIGALFILYGILYFFPFVMVGSAWGYIFLGLTLSMIRFFAGKKSKTLEEFEPEPEEEIDR